MPLQRSTIAMHCAPRHYRCKGASKRKTKRTRMTPALRETHGVANVAPCNCHEHVTTRHSPCPGFAIAVADLANVPPSHALGSLSLSLSLPLSMYSFFLSPSIIT